MRNFKKEVLEVVSRIPKGKVLSYKEVAEKAGRPRAWRAVGNILRQNFSKKIPCHRVIYSNGRIGNYNRGAQKKCELLTKEGIRVTLL